MPHSVQTNGFEIKKLYPDASVQEPTIGMGPVSPLAVEAPAIARLSDQGGFRAVLCPNQNTGPEWLNVGDPAM